MTLSDNTKSLTTPPDARGKLARKNTMDQEKLLLPWSLSALSLLLFVVV